MSLSNRFVVYGGNENANATGRNVRSIDHCILMCSIDMFPLLLTNLEFRVPPHYKRRRGLSQLGLVPAPLGLH